MKKRVNAPVLFLAILALGMMTLVLFMSFLPPDDHPRDHPLVHIAGRAGHARKSVLDHSSQHKSLSRRKLPPPSMHKQQTRSPRYYMVFSTSCSPFQNWQALAFFHFAKKVNQPGNVTRLVSGCTEKEAEALKKVHAERIAPLDPGFQLHITPDFDVRDDQKYWNKPHGLFDWMEKELGFPDRAAEHNDDIIIIVDPDMMLLRPITHKFDNFKTEWKGKFKTNEVVHGIPIAQEYGYGNAWLQSLNGNLSYVVGPDSPALEVSLKDAETYYPAGPPYLATGKDMYAIATHWIKFLPRVHDLFPEFMAEMHAYSIAAAHLQLPHQLAKGFMVSDVSSLNPGEGFGFLENVTRSDACSPGLPEEQLPLVLHYCQRYSLGRWFFSKYKLREDFFECEAPLLREPPLNVGEIYDWNDFPNGVERGDFSKPKMQHHIVLHGWMMCAILFALNEVAIDIKKKHCGANANFEKTFHFHDEVKFQAMLDDPSNPFHMEGTTDNPP